MTNGVNIQLQFSLLERISNVHSYELSDLQAACAAEEVFPRITSGSKLYNFPLHMVAQDYFACEQLGQIFFNISNKPQANNEPIQFVITNI